MERSDSTLSDGYMDRGETSGSETHGSVSGSGRRVPKSMSVGQRNVVRSNDSESLWNCTLSPGWTRAQAEMLRKALVKFGVGNWKDIFDHGCIPGKTVAQLNLQTQRMLGQQSTAEFQGLHIDPVVIGRINSLKRGRHIIRKNGYIINSGSKLTRAETMRRIVENRRFEWPEAAWKSVLLPTAQEARAMLLPAAVRKNSSLEEQLKDKELEIAFLERELKQLNDLIQEKENEPNKSSDNENVVTTT